MGVGTMPEPYGLRVVGSGQAIQPRAIEVAIKLKSLIMAQIERWRQA